MLTCKDYFSIAHPFFKTFLIGSLGLLGLDVLFFSTNFSVLSFSAIYSFCQEMQVFLQMQVSPYSVLAFGVFWCFLVAICLLDIFALSLYPPKSYDVTGFWSNLVRTGIIFTWFLSIVAAAQILKTSQFPILFSSFIGFIMTPLFFWLSFRKKQDSNFASRFFGLVLMSMLTLLYFRFADVLKITKYDTFFSHSNQVMFGIILYMGGIWLATAIGSDAATRLRVAFEKKVLQSVSG